MFKSKVEEIQTCPSQCKKNLSKLYSLRCYVSRVAIFWKRCHAYLIEVLGIYLLLPATFTHTLTLSALQMLI